MLDILTYTLHNPVALYLIVAVLSLCIGSFLNVVIYRTPKIMMQEWKTECHMLFHSEQAFIDEGKLTLSTPASTCPNCHTSIRWYQNIPVVSWIVLRGKCAYCKTPISIRYPLIELLTLFCSLTVVMVFGPTLQALCGLILTWVLIALTFIDFDEQYLPDHLTLPLAALGLGVNSFEIYTSTTSAIWGYIIGFLCLWLVYYVYKLITGKHGMGYGDFKLLAALGAWVGFGMIPLIVLLSSLLGSIIGIILLKVRKKDLPFAFGPYIAIAGWIALLWGEPIVKAYLGN